MSSDSTSRPRSPLRQPLVAILLALAFIVGACGSTSGEAAVPVTTTGAALDLANIEGEALLWFWAPW